MSPRWSFPISPLQGKKWIFTQLNVACEQSCGPAAQTVCRLSNLDAPWRTLVSFCCYTFLTELVFSLFLQTQFAVINWTVITVRDAQRIVKDNGIRATRAEMQIFFSTCQHLNANIQCWMVARTNSLFYIIPSSVPPSLFLSLGWKPQCSQND